MLNIVTRQLLKAVEDPDLSDFIMAWDRLESLVIDVYKRGGASGDECRAYAEIRSELLRDYARWRLPLRAFWQPLEVEGRPVEEDPFEALLRRRRAEAFVDDWAAMQTLPVARQAINHFLLDLGGG